MPTSPEKPSIAIVGGGIGGLTAAAALHRKGFPVEVYEAASSYANVGGGHWMYTNALDTLERIDPTLVPDLEALGTGFDGFLFTNNRNERLMFEPTAPYSRSDRAPLVLHRADIIEQLAKRVPKKNLHFGKRLARYESGVLHFEDGTQADAPLVIGADGIHSKVRYHALTQQPPRFSGQVGLWGIGPGPLPEGTGKYFQEMWGNGIRMGFTYVGTGGVYWFMVVKTRDIPTDPDARREFILERAKAFPEELSEVVRRTDPESIHTNPLYDVAPLWRWHTSNVCCLGDAVHACTPNLGQGGCQAIEDGFWIAEMLEAHSTPAQAFAAFQRKRWWRVAVVVYGSRTLGQFGQTSGAIRGWIRNTLVRLTPPVFLRPMLFWIMTLRPGWHEATSRRLWPFFVALLFVGVLLIAAGDRVVRTMVWESLAPYPMVVAVPAAGLTHSASSCSPCHADIHREWSQSPMAASMSNPAFLLDWERNQDSLPTCLHCHAPLLEQQPKLLSDVATLLPTVSFREASNHRFDEALQAEGVTCLACHGAEEGIATLQEARDACVRCHTMPMSPLHPLNRPLIDTVGEHARWQAATGRSEGCVECHMTATSQGRTHDFRGIRGSNRSLLIKGVARETSEVRVAIENLAGHRLPSGEPSSSIQVRLRLADPAGTTLHEASTALTRVVAGPPFREVSDTTLAPAEIRIVRFEVPPLDEETVISLQVIYERAAHLPGVRERLQKEGAAISHVLASYPSER